MSTTIPSAQVAKQIRLYRDEYDSRVSIHHYHVSEVNRLTQQAIDYLKGFSVDNREVEEAFSLCIARLEQVIINSNEFSKGIRLKPGNRYTQTEDEYSHKDPTFWYIQVIGSAEGALNDLLETMGYERR